MNVLCSVYDQKANFFSAPFCSSTAASAVRDFQNAVKDTRAMVDKFPKDYVLYQLGLFDPDTGEISPQSVPLHLASGADYLEE